MTISRQRGSSIDREPETVQPTGIPAHMRRQPSPPPPRTPSPPPIWQRKQHQPRFMTSDDSPPHRRMSCSPVRAATRPDNYIKSHRETKSSRSMAAYSRDHNKWAEPEPSSDAVYDYRHRSRSPIQPRGRHASSPPYIGKMRGYRSRSPELRERRLPSPETERIDRRPASPRQWKMLPPLDYRGNYTRGEFMQVPSPESRYM